jgi:hypothetical protein
MRAITLSILLAAIISAAPAVAKNNSSQVTENQVGAAASEGSPKKICRRLAETGTRIVERVCLTKEEWKQVEQIK